MAAENEEESASFASFGLDARLSRAILKAGFVTPTLVQATAIPIALQGRDILCRAKTGSGKTAAYTLPLLQKIIAAKDADPTLKGIQALILVPTRELCEQVRDHVKQMTFYCASSVTCIHIAADVPVETQRRQLLEQPDVVVATPARIVTHLDTGSAVLKESLQTLVIDEADLILSFGFDEDLRRIVAFVPKVVQTFLMSATLNSDVEQLKQLVLKKAAILRLEEGNDDSDRLAQYFVKTVDHDKFLLLYFILKLKLVQGKAIIFVNSIERCYRLKLFLEQFSINSCVLNAELPQNSRYHIVQEFNRGVYDYIIATDEAQQLIPADPEQQQQQQDQKKKKARKADAEFGVSRGVDFQDVAIVFNFDFPATAVNYTHRVGRTARANKTGTALSFVVESDEALFNEIQAQHATPEKQGQFQPFRFKMADVDAFRYRVDDALRSVTRGAIREARLKEIKAEIMNSEKLKAHFEDNPNDLAALRHDKTLLANRVSQDLKHIPQYLLPRSKIADAAAAEPETTAPAAAGMRLFKKRKYSEGQGHGNKRQKKTNPLKSFTFTTGSTVETRGKKPAFKKRSK